MDYIEKVLSLIYRPVGFFKKPSKKIKSQSQIKYKDSSQKNPTVGILTVHNYLRSSPISNTTKIKEACSVSLPTVLRSLATLGELGIVEEVTGKERHKVFVYRQYIDILNSGIDPT